MRSQDDAGLTLIEVMVAIFILAVAVLAMAAVSTDSLVRAREARDREQATNLASSVIESLRALDYSQVVLAPGAAGTTCFRGEPVVEDAAPLVNAPHTTTGGLGNRFTATTYITWHQGNAPDADCTGADDADRTAKRISVTVRWDEGGRQLEVEQDTILASAGRGLPVPEFDLAPSSQTLSVDPAQVSSGDGDRVCARHQLRNLGAEDRYDWTVSSVGGTPFNQPPTNGTFALPNNKWAVTGYLEYPAASSDPEPPNTAVKLIDTDGNDRPDSNIVVGPDTTANLWFCYDPASGVSAGDDIQTTVSVHSRFNENQANSVVHTVNVGTTGRALYLYDRIDDTQHPRDADPRDNRTVYPIYTMGPEDGIAGSTENLGTIDYADPTKSNWDSELNAYPGLRIAKPAPTVDDRLEQATWHEQFTAASGTTLDQEANLRLWISTTNRLAGVDTGLSVQQVNVTVEHLRSNENTVLHTFSASSSPTAVDTDEGPVWVLVDIPVDFGGDLSIGQDEFLSVRVSCDSSSTEDCHVAYDNRSYPSALYVVEK